MKINFGNLSAALLIAQQTADQILVNCDEHTRQICAYFACGFTGKQIKTALILENFSVDVNENYMSACKWRYQKQIKQIRSALRKVSQTEAIQLYLKE